MMAELLKNPRFLKALQLGIDNEQIAAAMVGPELADFAAAVLDGKKPEAGAEHSLGELRTALAIYRSAESGVWEKVWT